MVTEGKALVDADSLTAKEHKEHKILDGITG
jgi:hypothetical protein